MRTDSFVAADSQPVRNVRGNASKPPRDSCTGIPAHSGIIPAAMDQNVISHQTSGYTVTIPVYEGPLDLLLQLIEHAELDITAVSLAQVTDQYLTYIRQIQVPANDISAFLVVAAKLLQIKSEALLPRPPVREAGEEDLGEALARQLQIYKRFKEIANWLDEREALHLRTYLRVAPPLKIEGRLDLSDITLAELMAAAEGIFAEEAEKEALGTVISAPRITIREKLSLIAERLDNNSKATFISLLGQKPSRLEVVVTFLALLELIKQYRVAAQQASLFSDIEIEKAEDWGKEDELEIEFE
jgi:segregation and condensation protein A